MPRYLVTGATGFLGGEIVKQLIGRGHQVIALVRTAEKAALLKALGVTIHVADISDRESLRQPMIGVDGVFHTAGWYRIGVKHSREIAERVNVRRHTQRFRDRPSTADSPRGLHQHGRRVRRYARPDGRRDLLRTRPLPDRVRSIEVDRALRGRGADDQPGPAARRRDARLRLRAWRHQRIHRTLADLLRGRLFITPKGATFAGATSRTSPEASDRRWTLARSAKATS